MGTADQSGRDYGSGPSRTSQKFLCQVASIICYYRLIHRPFSFRTVALHHSGSMEHKSIRIVLDHALRKRNPIYRIPVCNRARMTEEILSVVQPQTCPNVGILFNYAHIRAVKTRHSILHPERAVPKRTESKIYLLLILFDSAPNPRMF